MTTCAWIAASLFLSLWAVAGCDAEKRVVGATAPVTPPTGAADTRITAIESNKYQQSQGGLYFTWYGCGGCHAQNAPGQKNFNSSTFAFGRDIPSIYDSIAGGRGEGMPAYKDRIPSQQIWQLAVYVNSLPKMNPYLRRREDFDEKQQPTPKSPLGAPS